MQFATRLFGIQLNKAKIKAESDGRSSSSGYDKKKKDRDKDKAERKAAKTVYESETYDNRQLDEKP